VRHLDPSTHGELANLAGCRCEIALSFNLPTTPVRIDTESDRLLPKTLCEVPSDIGPVAGTFRYSI
jgi:hypothetical protein